MYVAMWHNYIHEWADLITWEGYILALLYKTIRQIGFNITLKSFYYKLTYQIVLYLHLDWGYIYWFLMLLLVLELTFSLLFFLKIQIFGYS